ncbi:MAG: chloride channel protein [Coriobacteriia bacterium]|nr:chloride channel protein [Coriobacteriia bacterium]
MTSTKTIPAESLFTEGSLLRGVRGRRDRRAQRTAARGRTPACLSARPHTRPPARTEQALWEKSALIRPHQARRLWLQARRNFGVLLALCVAAAVIGALLASFLYALDLVTKLRAQHLWLIALLPVVAVATTLVYQKFGAGAEHGNNMVIADIHDQATVPGRTVVLTYVFSLLTHLTGGSAGREGAGVAIGASLFAKLARWLHFRSDDRRVLTMAGVAAGFSAIFGTPFSGAFFGLEMAFVGKVSYEALVPCFVASYVANIVCRLLGIAYEKHALQTPVVPGVKLVAVVLAAVVLFGVLARVFIVGVRHLKRGYGLLLRNPVLRSLVAGAVVAALLLGLGLERYGGLSTWMIQAGFSGQTTFLDPLAKLALTMLTLAVGLQGGEVTPLFCVGASLGGALAVLTHTDVTLLAGLGMIAIFGAAANAPLTTIALGIELFGVTGLPYYVAAALIGYFLVGSESLYPSQVIATAKSHGQRYRRSRSLSELRRP